MYPLKKLVTVLGSYIVIIRAIAMSLELLTIPLLLIVSIPMLLLVHPCTVILLSRLILAFFLVLIILVCALGAALECVHLVRFANLSEPFRCKSDSDDFDYFA